MKKQNISVFDFDGTFYKTPTPDIPKLEDAIDIAMFRLFIDKIEKAKNANTVLEKLDAKFAKLDKTSITPNLHNENSNKLGPTENFFGKDNLKFSEYISNINKNGDKTNVILARTLAKMMEPNGAGNHRVSGMINLGLDISQKDIEKYYKKYATIKYKNIQRNEKIELAIATAKLNGEKLFIYTDNSKNNVISGMKTLDYNPKDFEIVDMFDCNGGQTKKMQSGINAFKDIIKKYCLDNNVEYNLNNLKFYDDNKKICENMASNGIQSFHVSADDIKEIKSPINLVALNQYKNR